MVHLVFFKLSNLLWNEVSLAGQVSTQMIICTCVKAREVHNRLVLISALGSVNCQTVQHFPTLSFCHYSNF